MSLSDKKIYIDTEESKLEKLELEHISVFYFEKDGINHVVFELDGYYFIIYGSVNKGELLKIADSIQLNKKIS